MTGGDWRDWTVAVTGMNARADNPGPGVAVARCLSAERSFCGQLVALGYDALDPGLHLARLFDRGALLPYPSAGPQALRARLDELMRDQPFDAIVPSLDAELPNFVALAGWLAERGVRVLLPDQLALRRRDKDRLPELCATAGVATPPCRRLFDSSPLERPNELGCDYPLVLKGAFYGAKIVASPAEARAAFDRFVADWGYPVLAQPFVAGVEVNLAGIGDGAGGMIAFAGMRKRAVTDAGKAWSGVTIADPALEDMARRLVGALRWRGPFEIEAMREPGGHLQLIEMNPRFPAWIYLSAGAGLNLPALLLRRLAGEATQPAFAEPGHCFIRYADEVVISPAELARVAESGESLRRDVA